MSHRFLRWLPALLFLLAQGLFAQDADVPGGHLLYHYIDRLDIKGVTGGTVHTDYKPYSRRYVSELFERTDTQGFSARDRSWFDLMRIAGDDDFAQQQESKGIFKALYRNGRDFFALEKENLRLFINPVIHLSAGKEITQFGALYRNSRGVQVRGTLFDKLGFFTELSENQLKTPGYVRNTYNDLGVLPGENFVKEFDANTPLPGYDFFNARGYITYSPAEAIRIKLGRDRAFFGNGYQSLLLSDHATDYFLLNIDTRIWKLQYVNHFTMMTDFIRDKPDGLGVYPKKFAVFHELFYKPWHWLSVGLFESVVYSPTLPGGQRGFEIEYLNPIIFYRSVEQSLGSPDNSLLGLSWKLNALSRFQLYGQLMLDDYNFRNRSLGTGYWGNKYGWQAGLKYIDAFWVPRLDLQVEYNRIRPYTYQHFNPTASYSHYGQYLAHTMGANLHDLNVILRYNPLPRWNGTLVFTSLFKGLDRDGENYGGNVFVPYPLRVQDFNNVVGQGDPLRVTNIYGRLSYRLLRLDAWLDLEGRLRRENDEQSLSVMGSVRMNMPAQPRKY